MLLDPHDFELRLRTREEAVAEPFDAWRGIVVLDATVYPDLQAEGWARDFVRLVQAARKEMRLHVADRIELAAFVAPVLKHALHEHREHIGRETLTVTFHLDTIGALPAGKYREDEVDGHPVKLRIGKAKLR